MNLKQMGNNKNEYFTNPNAGFSEWIRDGPLKTEADRLLNAPD